MVESKVRGATPADRDEIWRLFRLGHAENGIFPLSEKKVDYFLDRVLYPKDIHPLDQGVRGAIGVIGDAGHLEGLVFVILGSYWYSEAMHVEECIVFVDPLYRKSLHAKALINWMKSTSDKLEVPLITGIVSNIRTEAKCRLYGRMLPKVGEFYLYKKVS